MLCCDVCASMWMRICVCVWYLCMDVKRKSVSLRCEKLNHKQRVAQQYKQYIQLCVDDDDVALGWIVNRMLLNNKTHRHARHNRTAQNWTELNQIQHSTIQLPPRAQNYYGGAESKTTYSVRAHRQTNNKKNNNSSSSINTHKKNISRRWMRTRATKYK